MWTAGIWIFMFLCVAGLWALASGRQCGFPGRPRNGTSATAATVSRPGDTVHYTCRPGYTLFGEEERVCLDSGIWAGRQPLCELNLALDRSSLVSATLWNYRASLAVDGNPDTCSFTPRTAEQRWWQVDLGTDQHVGSVALIINKDSYQEFTIFVIQLLSKSEALYKPCSTFKGRFQNPRILFTCNDGLGHQGRYVYIRDDRRDQDYFGLCEVEVFAYRDESICGEPEEPMAGHVAIGSDATAIYSCDSGYRLLAEPNRTCERDGHWTGHAPQCEAITCGYPQLFRHSEVQLLNHSTLWNSQAMYTCKAGYSFTPGLVDVIISCLSSGAWEKINITCIADDDRNLPVKLTGKEWGQESEHPGPDSEDDGVGLPGIISIGIFCSLLVIILSVLGILLARRLQSKKTTRSTPQSSTNDLIISNAKDGAYDDVTAPGFQTIMAVQPQRPPTPKDDSQANNVLLYVARTRQPACYDTLQSFPSVSSYNSTVVTDIEQDQNYARIKRGDADGEGARGRDCMQEKPRHPLGSGYETARVQTDSDRPVSIPQYETVQNLQQTSADSAYEIIQPNGSIGNLGKSKNKIHHSIPTALKMLLQPISKPTESELCDGAVPTEIMALYAQVDKTKKRKYRSDVPNNLEANHVIGNHVSSQTDKECECMQQPISDIVHLSQDSFGPGLWNGNSKDCATNLSQDCSRVSSPNGRPLMSIPNIRFIHTSHDSQLQNQTLECAQL